MNVVNVDGSISQNGVHSLTGMPSADRTVSLSPDAAVRESDSSIESSENRHVVLGTCASLPQTSSHAGTCSLLTYFQYVARDSFIIRRSYTRSCALHTS